MFRLAIVGITDQYINERLNHDDYVLTIQVRLFYAMFTLLMVILCQALHQAVLNRNAAPKSSEEGANEDSPVLLAEDGHIRFDEE